MASQPAFRPHGGQVASRHAAAPPTGSQTQTIQPADSQPSQDTPTPPTTAPILRLRGAHAQNGPRVQWAEGTVDNEGLGRKSSKVCCIYHAPREVGESSAEEDDSSSGSDSSSDSGSDAGGAAEGGARPARGYNKGRRRKGAPRHDHEHDEDCEHHGGRRRPSPNAYERQPKPRAKTSSDQGGPEGHAAGSSSSGSGKKST